HGRKIARQDEARFCELHRSHHQEVRRAAVARRFTSGQLPTWGLAAFDVPWPAIAHSPEPQYRFSNVICLELEPEMVAG
ncbi:MAG TPA: hypothetical protein VE998_02300, partial [Terriglobales bacterium]|nr:hypothetical protein [Terriglobales bacterium]